MNIDIRYLIWFCISVSVFLASLVWAIRCWVRRSQKKYILTSLRVLTIGTFISCLCFFIPYYYHNEFEFAGIARPFLAALYSTLQAFVLEFSFTEFTNRIPELNSLLSSLYSGWVFILCIVAPILTLTNILSLFNAFISELRIKITFRKALYIFSELNEQSIAIAKSIRKIYDDSKKETANKKKIPRPLFVFTDCYPMENELDQDLLQEAYSLRSVCVKSDITHLKLSKKRYSIEFFVIGMDDSENIEQAIKLNDEYKESSHCSVYLYSPKPNAAYIIDSIDKGKLTITSGSLTKENASNFLKNETTAKKAYKPEDNYYYIRRVNVVDAFTVKALTDNSLMSVLSEQAESEKTITLMIIGLGMYGTAFLKNALWLYQLKGCTLKIHIVESDSRKNVRSKLAKEMPGLADHLVKNENNKGFLHYRSTEQGDCQFDIYVYHSVDCESSDLSDLILRQNRFTKKVEESGAENDQQNTFSNVRAAFVTLGDDSKDIETAVTLRGLFDKINHIKDKDKKNEPNELPLIYSIVYDNRTAKNLNCGFDIKKDNNQSDDPNTQNGIICYNKVPYHIHFIGRMSQHYHYDTIREMKRQEFGAIYYHVEWIQNENDLRDCFRTNPNEVPEGFQRNMLTKFQAEMQAHFDKYHNGKETWNDSNFYYTDKELKLIKEKGEKLLFEPERINITEIESTVRSYDRFEYYRDSSVAKETYCDKIRDDGFKDYFDKNFSDSDHIRNKPLSKICTCKKCIASRESEHMRWNAYMISKGYRYDKIRNDRAKTHPNMISWQLLPVSDRFKD